MNKEEITLTEIETGRGIEQKILRGDVKYSELLAAEARCLKLYLALLDSPQ